MILEVTDLINFWSLDLKNQTGNVLSQQDREDFVKNIILSYQDKLKQKIKDLPNDAELGNWIRKEINK